MHFDRTLFSCFPKVFILTVVVAVIYPGEFGVSVVVITLDSNLDTSLLRAALLIGPPESTQALAYDDSVTLAIAATATQNVSLTLQGFSPLLERENTIPASACVNTHVPQFVGLPSVLFVPEYTAPPEVSRFYV